MKPAAFLDRDGTINREVHYLSRADQFELLPGVGPALKRLADAGYLLVVVTNQSGIARGYFTEDDLAGIHRAMAEQLAPADVSVDRIYFSPALPDAGDPDRKPGTGMIDKAVAELDIDLTRSWMIGDKTVDILTGKNAGVRTMLVKTGYGGDDGAFEVEPDAVAEDLPAAVDVILG